MRSFVGGISVLTLLVLVSCVAGCEHKVRHYKTKSAADEPTNVTTGGTPATEPTSAPKWETPTDTAKGPEGACQTTCGVDSSSTLPGEDTRKIANAVDPLLKESWSCLKRVGAYKIEPTVLLRIASDGNPQHVRFDVGGYEDLSCMKEIDRKFPRLHVSKGANVRCELRCAN